MDEAMRIYVDRLRGQGVEHIREAVGVGFLDVDEADLRFVEPVQIVGEAYLVQHELVLKLAISASAIMPCAICNESVEVPIRVELTDSIPETAFKSGIFDMSEIVREAILLEVPLAVECHEGQCPARQEIAQYLKEKRDSDQEDGQGFRPFADLDREE
jgi:uncharacterized metal-binding protein YceD (DUF177 family)